MIEWVCLAVLVVLIVFIAILCVRAIGFVPKTEWKSSGDEIVLDEEKIVSDMQEMIRCKTVSYNDSEAVCREEFIKFQNLLPVLYPKVHEVCERQFLGNYGILYHWKGKEKGDPIVLMSHYDVVPVEESQWEKPAFDGIVENGILWGRGTLDTKGTLCGILEAAEKLMTEGFVPQRDIYFSFSGDEEINGTSCDAIVDWFAEHNIRPVMVLDEGGAVVENVFPGVVGESAMIGIAEKGYANIELSELSRGGHASTPPMHTIVGELAQAVVQVEKHPFKRQLTRPVQEMFNTLGRYSTFVYKLIFANLWCFEGVLDFVCKKSGGELNAMMRTTCAVTKMQGSDAYNVLPPKASVGMNLRLLGNDTVESARAYIEKIVANKNIEVTVTEGRNPSPVSRIDTKEWECLCQSVKDTWKDTLVTPYLMMACSDSWHYNRVSDCVYKFSAMKMSKEERGLVHGNNERVPVETLVKTVEFYVRLIQIL